MKSAILTLNVLHNMGCRRFRQKGYFQIIILGKQHRNIQTILEFKDM